MLKEISGYWLIHTARDRDHEVYSFKNKYWVNKQGYFSKKYDVFRLGEWIIPVWRHWWRPGHCNLDPERPAAHHKLRQRTWSPVSSTFWKYGKV